MTVSNAASRPALLAGAAVLTILVGFGAGFALAGSRGGSTTAPVAAGPVTTTTTAAVAPPPADAPTTETITTETTTTAAPPPTTTTAVPTTTAPATATTVATTVAPAVTVAPRPTPKPTIAAPPTTFAPPNVSATFPADAAGRLVVPRSGSVAVVLTNTGGLPSQWLLTGTGFGTTGGPTQGTLVPGQSVLIGITAPSGEVPKGEVTGIISILGANNATIAFVIPPG